MSKRVLIVEDDDILRELYELKLSMEGYAVATAVDGQAGIDMVQDEMPDLIILDMMMPRLDGMGFLERFQSLDRSPKAAVLVASNKSTPVQIEAAKELGARDYLIKSDLTPDDLVDHVRRHLQAA